MKFAVSHVQCDFKVTENIVTCTPVQKHFSQNSNTVQLTLPFFIHRLRSETDLNRTAKFTAVVYTVDTIQTL